LLDAKEDAMQAAVDQDDFESASQLQEEIDLLTDRLEALG
jgi:protein-arginine kinase activator protein McsA